MVTVQTGAVKPAGDFSLYPPEVFLEISGYLGILHERHLEYQRREYRRGHAVGYADGYTAGTNAAMRYVKRVNGLLVESLKLEAARWGPKGRAGFGEPRPGDYRGAGK